jgi:hypothetical protein
VNAIPYSSKVLENDWIALLDMMGYDTHLHISKNLVSVGIRIKRGFALVFDFFHPEWGVIGCPNQTTIGTAVVLAMTFTLTQY